MHPHEEAVVHAFIASKHQARWLNKLASVKHRWTFLNRLNHCYDFDERYAQPLSPTTDVVALLRSLGAPANCHVISDFWEIDGQELPLADVVARVQLRCIGTIVSCVPGRLAYYNDEVISRRLLLSRAESARS